MTTFILAIFGIIGAIYAITFATILLIQGIREVIAEGRSSKEGRKHLSFAFGIYVVLAVILSFSVVSPAVFGSAGSSSRGIVDASGNATVTVGTLLAGEDQTNNRLMTLPKYSYNHITSAATTVVKGSAGVLHTIVVNTTAAGTITIYDNTAASGTVVGILKASVGENTYTFDTNMTTGITVVTGAASDITVSYL